MRVIGVAQRLRTSLAIAALLCAQWCHAADSTFLTPGENLVLDGIPPIPAEFADKVRAFGSFSAASMVTWHPSGESMLIRTRQKSTSQLFLLAKPGTRPEPLTDLAEAVSGGTFQPGKGEYILFEMGSGGDEVFRIYRMDIAGGKVVPISVAGERAGAPAFNRKGDRIVYTTSTVDRNRSSRGNEDGEEPELTSKLTIWIADPLQPETAKKVASYEGMQFGSIRFAPDEKSLLMQEPVSANESHLWLLDLASGEKRRITPAPGKVPVYYGAARYSRDGTKLYAISDRDSEFRRLIAIDLATGRETVLAPQFHFDVAEFSISEKANRIAIITEEEGSSVLRFLELESLTELPRPALLPGVISGLHWRPDATGKTLAFNMVSARSPGAAFALDIGTNRLTRWTPATTRGVSAFELVEPQLIHWKSFDGTQISGYLYAPDAQKFPGKRPVLVNIHGGPEGQARPGFLGRNNYLVNELGIALIYPNVRGSSGFGKSFLAMDNGIKREDSVKDIGALFDWIASQENLDAAKVLVKGGSYGGYMSLAVSTLFADRIAGAIDVVGISDFVTFLTNTESYRRDLRRAEYGDERDPDIRAFFDRISPLKNAAKVTKPLFIIQGKNDPRVPYTEAVQMVEQLKKQKTPVWFLMAKDEGHGFTKRGNADFEFYAELKFLEQLLLK
ncbi:MAG: S9 family peptidase [Betaproteobacteria bacterium]|nr:S9 family peptidase [Betaproteobacteria bacterium]